jgi:hypothetical protein
MAEIVWPAELPDHVQIEGYGEEFPGGGIEYATAVGPPRARDTGTTFRPLTLALLLTRDQVDLLEEFYLDTTASGTLPFTWKLPRADRNGVRQPCRMQFVAGARPKPVPQGCFYWKASLNLRALPPLVAP